MPRPAPLLALASLVATTLAAPAAAPAQPTSSFPRVRVAAADASIDQRAARRLLTGYLFASCQVTWMGGTIDLRAVVAPNGEVRVRVDRVRGEGGITRYVQCVRRRASRAVRGQRVGSGAFTLVVEFPALGLPSSPARP